MALAAVRQARDGIDHWRPSGVEVRPDFLMTTHGLSCDDAYMLTSVACDVDITQLVDGNVGVHVMIPKAIFSGSKR
jgi:acetamidase/formamidase